MSTTGSPSDTPVTSGPTRSTTPALARSHADLLALRQPAAPGLAATLERAARHRGTSFVEIYQDCNIFNHGAFAYATGRKTRADNVVYLEHGKPLVFGKNRDKGIRIVGCRRPEVVELNDAVPESDLLVHDEKDETLAFLLSRFSFPDLPEPMGVFHAVEDECYEDLLERQISEAVAKKGAAGETRRRLLNSKILRASRFGEEGATFTIVTDALEIAGRR